jgi:hypothetical protein
MVDVPFAREKITIGQTSSKKPIILTRRTIAILEDAGGEVGKSLVDGVVKGSYHIAKKGDKSKGTHDGGGVFDLSGSLATPAVELALRNRGVAAWIRVPPAFDLHIHGVDAFHGDDDLSPEARQQVAMYKTFGSSNDISNGLPGSPGPDTDRPHPKLVRFLDPEDDMQLTDQVKLKRWQRKFFQGAEHISVGGLLADAAAQARRNKRVLDGLVDTVDDLTELVGKPMSEAEKKALASAVAAKVVKLRSELSSDQDDAEDPTPDIDTS